MSVEHLEIKTTPTRCLSVSKFNPQQSNAKTIVISSATGVLKKYYAKFAHHFSTLGFTVYTFDYYGIGKSKTLPIKKNNSNLNDWANDQAEVLALAKTDSPNIN
ncbi:alpha/beta hydrolase [Lacinutrix neustonica]|uniref:Alpha/beta hydrolase n=1 Tax=Lacinutrix neustonica TaxID=2980107 RepID=A0A9E8MUF8_9FLAO|nr:alpha/beta hydrolase [Lacinutrix neustonica]WAC01762.1 alpha/beta hydrolase [Lacinutrix neustonica]